MIYVGIDPGASGGMALLTPNGSVGTFSLGEKSDKDIWEWMLMVSTHPSRLKRPIGIHCVLEKVGGYVGGNPTPGSAMFNFGMGYGKLKMALVAAGIPHEEVQPSRWQKGLSIPPRDKAEGATAWKNRLKQHAENLFPDVKVTLAVADALLIAEFCKRSKEGTLTGKTLKAKM